MNPPARTSSRENICVDGSCGASAEFIGRCVVECHAVPIVIAEYLPVGALASMIWLLECEECLTHNGWE